MLTYEQERRIEELSVAEHGERLVIFESRDGSVSAVTGDGSVHSWDENGIPPCPTHEVFDCAEVSCQLAYAEVGL